ncbi:MAG: hypothetical protein R2797_08495 [Gelidibacter sp.]
MVQTKHSYGNTYFRFMAILLTALAVLGFGLFGIKHIDQMPPPTTVLVCHAAAMLGWYALLILQTQLIGRGNISTHKKLGRLSIGLVLGILIFGTLLNEHTYSKGTPVNIVAANFGALLALSIAYGVGLIYRNHPQIHKRAMLLAGIGCLSPALGRLVLFFDLPGPLAFLLFLALIASLWIFDMRTRKRPHKTSVILGITIIICQIGAFAFGSTLIWEQFVSTLWGT